MPSKTEATLRVDTKVDLLQQELDRRVGTLQREIAAQAEFAKAGLVAERDHSDATALVLATRLDAMDKATEVLNDIVTRVPTDVQQAVSNLQAVVNGRFDSVATQFAERDTRSERESRDNKLAVDAAFAAQEKQAVAQNDSNTLAISKSETATTETINKLAELFRSSTDALSDKIDDLKGRTGAIESRTAGIREAGGDQRQVSHLTIAGAMAVIAILNILAVVGVAVAIH